MAVRTVCMGKSDSKIFESGVVGEQQIHDGQLGHIKKQYRALKQLQYSNCRPGSRSTDGMKK